MKLFLCFVVLLLLVLPVSATNITEYFEYTGVRSGSFAVPGTTAINPMVGYVTFNNPESMKDIKYVTWSVPDAGWNAGNPSDDTLWESVTFSTYGTGQFGYTHSGSVYYMMIIFNDDFDISALSGLVHIPMTGMSTYYCGVGGSTSSLVPSGSTVVTVGGKDAAFYNTWTAGNIQYYHTSFYFRNDYTYDTVNGLPTMWIDKGTSPSMFNITDIFDESPVNTDDLKMVSNKTTWILDVTDSFGTGYSDTVNFVIDSVGIINLNQSSYTEPELIQIDAELTTYDFTSHAYTAYLQWQDDVGNWNTVSYVEYNESIGFYTDDPTKSIIGDIDFYKYEIPLRLRAVLIDFNKNTYVSTTVAESNVVLYNPPAGALYLVTGTVVDANTDAVVTGASVSVTGPMTQSDTTNVNGRFYLYLADGTYTFNTTKSGYEDNVDTGIIINSDTSGIEIPLVPVSTEEKVVYGTITDSDTKDPLNDVHIIFTNTTDTIHAYSASNGYYSVEGFNNDSVYAVRALKTGYYSYNGTITTETSGATHKSFDMVQTNYSATPTPTALSTYPGGEGHEWSNEEIITMLRVLVPGIFILMLIFLLLAVMLGFMPGNGGNQGGNSGLGELWKR